MNTYLLFKWLHIISSVLLVGTGFGSAFYLFFINRTKNIAAIAEVLRLVVRADFWFTAPAVLLQPITGYAMLAVAGMDMQQSWLHYSYALYATAGACWLPVVWLQIRMAKIAAAAVHAKQPLPGQYWQYVRYWEWLGYPAFVAMLAIYGLMVFKPNG